jgi:hypothetical protein
MKYGKYWFHLPKKCCFIAYFHVLGFFGAKKKSVCHALPLLPSGLKGYRFEISAPLRQLGWIDAPHTQNFEILKSLEQTQESKKLKSLLKFL